MATGQYAGDVSARDAWEILSRDPEAVLVDVRTKPEWVFVGVPDLREIQKTPVFVSWQVYPSMQLNPGFLEQIRRSGVTGNGFHRCHNVAGGFEGPLDARKHRGSVDGWRAADLPWVQE